MGSRARNFVLVHRRAGGFAQAVLAYLADCMNDQSGRCDPTRETIAEYFSAKDDPCTVKRVERALARLRTLGYIESKRVPYTRQTSAGQEGGWHNSYVLVGFVPGDSNAVRVTDISDVTPKTDVTPNLERGHPQNVQGVTPNLERGHPQNGGINQKEPERTRSEPESSMRTSGNSSAIAAVASAQAQTPYPEDFDQSLFDEAQREAQLAGEKPNTVKAEAPKRRTATPRKKPATRCPFGPDASIPPEYLEIAQKAGIGDPQQVFSAFVNHAIAHDRSLVVWPAGFRTWCSNELRYHPNQTPKPKPLHQRTAADYDW
ncbi:helix-turn-helix domain-containing protein [Sutterella wadsworthensis]|uniref:helix-turn-helix domain-containing protein n=1 Tax=Sutterella wadsworthensis TaxID=40545 RepID=UPI0039671480